MSKDVRNCPATSSHSRSARSDTVEHSPTALIAAAVNLTNTTSQTKDERMSNQVKNNVESKLADHRGLNRRKTVGKRPERRQVIAIEAWRPPMASDLERVAGVERALRTAGDRMKSGDELAKRSRKTLREAAAECYAVAGFLMKNEPAWNWFCRNSTWEHETGAPIPRPEDQPQALRFVLRRAERDADDSKRTSLFYRALNPLFGQNIAPAEIPNLVQRAGGWGKLAEKHVRKPLPAKRKTKSPAPKVVAGSVDLNIIARVRNGSHCLTGARQGDQFNILAKFEKRNSRCFQLTFEKIDPVPSC